MSGSTKTRPIGGALASVPALTLAVAALSGCDASEATPNRSVAPMGPPAVHGDLVTGRPDQSDPSRRLLFEPKFDAIVYLHFDSGAHLEIKHAFFPTSVEIPGEDEEEQENNEKKRLLCAVESIKKGASDSSCPMVLKFPETVTGGPVFDDFHNFKFGSQQRIYIYVENADAAFNRRAPISFTPFGASDTPVIRGGKKHENKSFYEARFIEDVSGKRDILTFNNYFRGHHGGEIRSNADNSRYSMNINLLICRQADADGDCDFSSPQDVIPIAIDPDTGNGWGGQPLYSE